MTPEHYARVKEVFLAVESLDPSKREDRITKLCGDDQRLLSDVLRLLGHHNPDAARREGKSLAEGESSQTIINDRAVQARMQPQQTSVGGWLCRNLRKHSDWLIFSVAIVLAAALAWHIDRQLCLRAVAQQSDALQARVESASGKLLRWASERRREALRWGRDERLQAVLADPTAAKGNLFESDQPVRYVIWDVNALVVDSNVPQQFPAKKRISAEAMVPFSRAMEAEIEFQFQDDESTDSKTDDSSGTNSSETESTRASSPTPKPARVAGEFTNDKLPSAWVYLPLYSASNEIAGVLCVHDRRWDDQLRWMFTENPAAEPDTIDSPIDTYCIDGSAALLTPSDSVARWLQIASHGATLSPDDSSAKRIRVADPGGDLMAGYRPQRSRRSLPLTEAAARVTTGENGQATSAYRDTSGNQVIGAWRWLPELKIGVICETPAAGVLQSVSNLRWSITSLAGLPLAIAGLAIFISNLVGRRLSSKDSSQAQRIGAYELLEKIGEGGMGHVYLARHSLLKRASAIKVLRPDRITMVDVGRFDREVKLAAQLTSPHTIRILDYGRTDDGLIYFAMEYLDGLTLNTIIARSGPLPAARVLHFLIQLCKSIEEAHGAGLIHRDIKPQNVIITRRGNEPDWLILFDFGLAKSVTPHAKEFRTRETIWSGTPMFMSPERVRTPAAVDPRMDIYAIGAVGYYMVTGREPFTVSSPDMIFDQVLNVMPDPPSKAGALDSVPALDAVLMRCLSKSADDRPADVTTLRQRLEELASKHPWSIAQANQWWTANPQPEGE